MGKNLMSKRRISIGRRIVRHAVLWGSAGILPGFFESCDDYLIGVTRYVDPCGPIFSPEVCSPGTLEANHAEVGDWSVDCTCTVPGACNTGIPQNVIADICR